MSFRVRIPNSWLSAMKQSVTKTSLKFPPIVFGVEGWTALMFAAAGGHAEVVKALKSGGANVSYRDGDGETALDFAANNGHQEVVQILSAR